MPFPPTPSQTASNTPTPSITASVTPTITPSLTNCPGLTPQATSTPTQTNTPSITSTQTGTPSITQTNTSTPTNTNTSTPTSTPTQTTTQTNTPTITPTPSVTPTVVNFSGTGFNSNVNAIIGVNGENKYYMGGNFTQYQGSTQNRILRVNDNGSKDTSFTGTGTNGIVYAIGEDTSTTKVYLGGTFTQYQGTNRNRICRVNYDGSLDTSFGIGTGFNDSVYAITLQSDGKILVGGAFTQYSGTSMSKMVRLNTDGTLDTTFNIGSGFGVSNNLHAVSEILIDSNDKIVVGGQFTGYNGTAYGNIVRLDSGGTVDTTFSSGTGFNNFTYGGINETAAGKYVVAGDFTSYDGTARSRLAQLNSDGTLDTGFPSTTIQNAVFASKIDSQGRIYLHGGFTTVSGFTKNGICRFTSGGTLDNNFVVGTGFNNLSGTVWAALHLDNDFPLYGGSFTTYSGQTVNYILKTNQVGDSLRT